MKPENPYPPKKGMTLEWAAAGTLWQEGFDALKTYLFVDCANSQHRFKGLVIECPECMKELEGK